VNGVQVESVEALAGGVDERELRDAVKVGVGQQAGVGGKAAGRQHPDRTQTGPHTTRHTDEPTGKDDCTRSLKENKKSQSHLGRAASPPFTVEHNYAASPRWLRWDAHHLLPKLPLPFDDLHPV